MALPRLTHHKERINQYALCRKRSDFENSVDPDQLASEKKPADLDQHCFSIGLCVFGNWIDASE